ncbi:hypothetical protein MNB_SV-4-1116 [hydrothermal vent metagenome]|uniref:Uncharacterized protein n=1 Tax=hydrothermal vent metagenome TaxID=652676 RepID=A0A1W1E8M7_9ZZZZ
MTKITLSMATAALLATSSAFGFGFNGNLAGGNAANGGSVNVGTNEHGGYICIEGHGFGQSGSAQISYGSASGCGLDDFDFYYKSTGGFKEDTSKVDAFRFKAGQDDDLNDGFWYREGAFSAPVYYGDPENGGKRYGDDATLWPAWTWGHPEVDPFVSEDGAGDDKGGAAGIGGAGFGVDDGNKLKAGDSDTFYPVAFEEINNNRNSFLGSYASDIAWNVTLYDRDHNKVFSKRYTTTLYYWETLNYAPKGFECPRSSVGNNETVNDRDFNQHMHDDFNAHWPVTGLDVDFKGDGVSDASWCADAITIKEHEWTDTFETGRFMMKKKYKVTVNGPYVYDESAEGCAPLNDEGLPDTDGKWSASCFKAVDTVWADERVKTRFFMRINVEEEKKYSIPAFQQQLGKVVKKVHDTVKQNVDEAEQADFGSVNIGG